MSGVIDWGSFANGEKKTELTTINTQQRSNPVNFPGKCC